MIMTFLREDVKRFFVFVPAAEQRQVMVDVSSYMRKEDKNGESIETFDCDIIVSHADVHHGIQCIRSRNRPSQ